MSRKVINNVFVANSSKCEITLSLEEYTDGSIIYITNENYEKYFNSSLISVSAADIILKVSYENQFGFAQSNKFIFPVYLSKGTFLNGNFHFEGRFVDEHNFETYFTIDMNNNGELINEHNMIQISDLNASE